MKRMELSEEEHRTLLDIGIYHPHARTRQRAQGVRMLALALWNIANKSAIRLPGQLGEASMYFGF